jgi:hypothetical protein
MPAIPEDIGPALREAAVATWTDDTVRASFPSSKDGAKDPREGFFDAKADAQAVAEAAAIWQGTYRRRFSAVADGEHWLDPSLGVPVVKIYDSETAIAGYALCSRIEVDLDTERTNLELYG